MDTDTKTCPSCAETIKSAALVCPHCRADVDDHKRKVHQALGLAFGAVLLLGCIIAYTDGEGKPVASSRVELSGAQVDAAADSNSVAPVVDPEAAKRAAEEKVNGFHCLTAWDGSNASLVDKVKAGLNDPDSFEHANTWIRPVDKTGRHYIKMVFRARNPFNAMVPAEAIGSVDPATCEARLTKVTSLAG